MDEKRKFDEVYESALPKWLKVLGCFGIDRFPYDVYRFHWGELSTTWGLALNYKAGNYDSESKSHLQIHFIFGNLFLYMPWNHEDSTDYADTGEWGFSYYREAHQIHAHWGQKCLVINMPWSWDHVRHDILYDYETHPYTYVLKSGEVQNRKATIRKEEREWKWRWFKWLPYPKNIRTYINIRFDGEVGEETGEWKGGCTGCSYDMKPDETPLQTLRRMEIERKF
jgi:hypothetical protein